MLRISVLSGRHELTVHSLSRSAESFTVSYSVAPPLPDEPGSVSPSASPVFMWLEAVDDLGNHYSDFGGARGLSPDGRRTVGSIAGQPGLPSGAVSLTVRLMFGVGSDNFGYDLVLPVPAAG
ncbi:hypothetical protein ACGF12_36890 [Kitasatospora sp. NPDC048296]|uniref:hypothetical protein n=1 Tax=Kitasatospora sp. NPDC048296 TaxID=3364048 RepID=UPI003721A366